MFGVVLALAAAASWGSADFLGGVSTRRLPILTVSAVSQSAGFLFAGTVVLTAGAAMPDERTVVIGVAAGLGGGVGLAALYSGLAIGPMGVVAPIAALSAVVPVAVGLARGERPGAIQLVGVALALVGVVLATRHRDETGERAHPRAVALAAVAAFFIGLMIVLLDEAGGDSPAWTVLMVRTGALSLLATALVARRPSFSMNPKQLGTLAGAGVLDNGANLMFVVAAQHGLLSLIAVLASLYPVTTVLLARVALHERLSRIQIAGIAMALAGVALIAR
ncbi:MAG: DMT family transporter [Actinomycetota bacterium]